MALTATPISSAVIGFCANGEECLTPPCNEISLVIGNAVMVLEEPGLPKSVVDTDPSGECDLGDDGLDAIPP